MLSIGQVARQSGLSATTLRYYEDAEVLPAPARSGGQRRYDQQVFRQLALVKHAQQAGFTIAEIRTLLHGFPAHVSAAERWRAVANPKRAAVQALMERVLEMHDTLEQISQCECKTLDQCAS
jgi:MerR family transcriptional regulator, redox-sensitive transcriptional activator SoxR